VPRVPISSFVVVVVGAGVVGLTAGALVGTTPDYDDAYDDDYAGNGLGLRYLLITLVFFGSLGPARQPGEFAESGRIFRP
jgi:hypothetical protein